MYFCNLMYGNGWMEIEREEVDRECNQAQVSVAMLGIRDQPGNVFRFSRSSSNHLHPLAKSSRRCSWLSVVFHLQFDGGSVDIKPMNVPHRSKDWQ
jgi:hypothetical protein